MATVIPFVKKSMLGSETLAMASWRLTNADTGMPVTLADWADKSIQVSGTFGGATVTIEGSNDGTNFTPLKDPSGALLAITAPSIRQVQEFTFYLRASSAGGTGTDVTVTLAGRKDNPKAGG